MPNTELVELAHWTRPHITPAELDVAQLPRVIGAQGRSLILYAGDTASQLFALLVRLQLDEHRALDVAGARDALALGDVADALELLAA